MARGLAPVRLRSSRQSGNALYLKRLIEWFGAATQPNGPSPLATGGCVEPRYNGMYLLNNARNAAGFTGLAK